MKLAVRSKTLHSTQRLHANLLKNKGRLKKQTGHQLCEFNFMKLKKISRKHETGNEWVIRPELSIALTSCMIYIYI